MRRSQMFICGCKCWCWSIQGFFSSLPARSGGGREKELSRTRSDRFMQHRTRRGVGRPPRVAGCKQISCTGGGLPPRPAAEGIGRVCKDRGRRGCVQFGGGVGCGGQRWFSNQKLTLGAFYSHARYSLLFGSEIFRR